MVRLMVTEVDHRDAVECEMRHRVVWASVERGTIRLESETKNGRPRHWH
jgi:hypothetical protein